jgi:hypothetical protein
MVFTVKNHYLKKAVFVIYFQFLVIIPAVSKHFDVGDKKATIEFEKAEVPLRAVMKQVGISKATLMRILSGRERILSSGLWR